MSSFAAVLLCHKWSNSVVECWGGWGYLLTFYRSRHISVKFTLWIICPTVLKKNQDIVLQTRGHKWVKYSKLSHYFSQSSPSRSACCCLSWTSSSSMAVFSFIHLQRKVFSIRKRVFGTRHLRVTGKKCGYFIVTFRRSDSSLSDRRR